MSDFHVVSTRARLQSILIGLEEALRIAEDGDELLIAARIDQAISCVTDRKLRLRHAPRLVTPN
jgi:hypothetical protein